VRVRYETRCGGRLLKVFEQVEPDVARAMLTEYGEEA